MAETSYKQCNYNLHLVQLLIKFQKYPTIHALNFNRALCRFLQSLRRTSDQLAFALIHKDPFLEIISKHLN